MSIIIGSIIAIGYNPQGNLPPGFLSCDGQEVNKSDYPDLYEAIGTAWGSSGEGKFCLPKLQGYFLRGVDDGSNRDPDAAGRTCLQHGGNSGSKIGSAQHYATALPKDSTLKTGNPKGSGIDSSGNHTHNLSGLPKDSSWYKIAGSHYAKWNSGSVTSSTDGSHTHDFSSGGDAETRPENVYFNYIIFSGAKK